MPRKTHKTIITSEEKWELVNIKNKKIMKEFLREKNARSSPATIKNYESDLKIFFTWNMLENEDKFFIDIKKREFSEFTSYCVDTLQWGSARFNRMRSVLSSLSEFVLKFYDEDYPNYRNIILKAMDSMPKNVRREKTILSEQQVYDLLKQISSDKQLACWLALAVASGARFSELLRFDIDIIDMENLAFDGIFIETSKPIKTKGRTKEGKLLKKYIIKSIFEPYYVEWMKERALILEKNGLSHNSMFIKKDGQPAEEGTIRSWLKTIEALLNVPFYPHCLRHFTTSYLSRTGLPYNLIKEIFGWESIEMVSIYDDVSAKDKEWKELGALKKQLEK